MKFHRAWRILTVLLLLGGVSACSKPKLYGSVQESEAIVKYFPVPPAEAYRAAKEALIFHGYSLMQAEEEAMTLETYWQPTTADSHYVLVFGRKDYGTVGAYYRMAVKVSPQGSGSRVSMTNVAKSFIKDLKSSQREEDAVFIKIADFTRKRNIDVTNIGLQ